MLVENLLNLSFSVCKEAQTKSLFALILFTDDVWKNSREPFLLHAARELARESINGNARLSSPFSKKSRGPSSVRNESCWRGCCSCPAAGQELHQNCFRLAG